MNTLVAILVITIHTQLQFSNAGVLNRTDDQYHILPIPLEELENLRVARQQTVPEVSVTLSPDVATNVAQILTGLFNEDVTPIVQGSSAFIPGGDLREGVQALLHGLSPLLQNVLFGPYQPPSAPQQNSATTAPLPPSSSSPTPPTHIQIVIQLNSANQLNSSIAKTTTSTTPLPTTTTTTTEQPETSTPLTIILKYRIKDKPSTTPSPTRIPGQVTTTKAPQPSQILLFFRHPNESYTRFPLTSFLPESPKLNTHLPDSPMLGVMSIENFNALLPESPMSSVIKQIIENKQAEFLKQVDEEVITPISTTEKQYIYLVLQNEEYEEFAKFTNKNRMSSQSQQQQPQLSISNDENNYQPQPQQVPPLPPVVSVVTSTSSPSTPTTTTSGSTTVDPDPKVKEDEDDDDDDRISITDILDAVISRRV